MDRGAGLVTDITFWVFSLKCRFCCSVEVEIERSFCEASAWGGKKTQDLNVGCQNKLDKESPKLRLDLPKHYHRLGLRS